MKELIKSAGVGG